MATTLPIKDNLLSCPVQGRWTEFQLVDPLGNGEPYAGLAYEATDAELQVYRGTLDAEGKGRVENHFAGPIDLTISEPYHGKDEIYTFIQERPHYPLKITELQVRAEQTRFPRSPQENPARASAGVFYQVEVRDLVEHVSHLPPAAERQYPPPAGVGQVMQLCGHTIKGVGLLSMRLNVLEVRPLRALRPLFSTDKSFSALNLYQFALMATLSYTDFGQEPGTQPVTTPKVCFPLVPSSGNMFGEALASFDEVWKVDQGQAKAYYPLYEDVPYSERLEIAPFDPALYPDNNPDKGRQQEHPQNIHFYDDRNQPDSTDTQAFITHTREIVLIAVRGTSEMKPDALRDIDAKQVPFEEGVGRVHRGFYEAAKVVNDFVQTYLEKFYTGQKLLICGHSLGGAVALLLSEILRRNPKRGLDIQLYTYGAPRAADSTFVAGAAELVHYRMVNHNDPVPSVPATWMDTKPKAYLSGAAITFANVPAGMSTFVAGLVNVDGDPYEHHGKLRHFMPVQFSANHASAILWAPGCDTLSQHAACTLAVRQVDGLPMRPGLLKQLVNAGDHSMVGSYIPHCWATLRRWQQAQELSGNLITTREYQFIDSALARVTEQLRAATRQMAARPDSVVMHQEKVIRSYTQEIDKIQATRERLATLRHERIGMPEVYGSSAQRPELLAEDLPRWQQHRENLVPEQLAMAPPESPDDSLLSILSGHPIGAPHSLDIDSIV